MAALKLLNMKTSYCRFMVLLQIVIHASSNVMIGTK